MDPLLPPETDREADADARRKIQFSVPSNVPIQLDPRQVEMVSPHGNSDGVGDVMALNQSPTGFVFF